MLTDISHFFILLCIGCLSLLFHEFGHIIASRGYQANEIRLIIGSGKVLFTLQYRRLKVSIHQWFFMHFVTTSKRNHSYTSKELIVISLMGPLFNIALAGLFYIIFHLIFPVYYLYIGFLFNVWLCLFNLFPFKIGQKATDGYMIYKIISNRK